MASNYRLGRLEVNTTATPAGSSYRLGRLEVTVALQSYRLSRLEVTAATPTATNYRLSRLEVSSVFNAFYAYHSGAWAPITLYVRSGGAWVQVS